MKGNAIVTDSFNEWTKDKNTVESRISIFNGIRDIPYVLIPELIDCDIGPSGILKRNGGSCSPKHFLLGRMFEMLSLPVRYVTYKFYWDSPKIDYPLHMMELLPDLPMEYHLACHAMIEDKWVSVDATWDLPLKKAGFPVNEKWNGKDETLIAVDPAEVLVHGSAVERDSYVKKQKESWPVTQVAVYRKFIDYLNTWLKDIRK